jgi:hypothetical protein
VKRGNIWLVMGRERILSLILGLGVSSDDDWKLVHDADDVVAWVAGYDFSGQISEAEMNEFSLLKWIDRIALVSSGSWEEIALLTDAAPCRQERTAKSWQNW